MLEEEFRTGRVTGAMIEPRGCMAWPDPIATNITLWTPTQIPHIVRTAIADHLDIRRIRPARGDAGSRRRLRHQGACLPG